jgi:ribose-phosphate pyrophosphokinase
LTAEALQMMREAGVGEIWSTDCIPHPTNAVSVAPLIAQAVLASVQGVG